MSCVELTEQQRETLRQLAAGQQPEEQAVVEELRRWGWVMPGTLELTGAGLAHADIDTPPGLL